MAEADRVEAQIYQLRGVIRGISPMILRRLLVRDDSRVAQLHEVLQIAFGWDDSWRDRPLLLLLTDIGIPPGLDFRSRKASNQ
jgi:hypothetical protein